MKNAKMLFILGFAFLLVLTACGKSKEVIAADELIAAIGEVTLESGPAITEAEKAVATLQGKDKEALENAGLLTSARAEYDRLVEEDRLKKEEERQIEEERVLNLVTSGSWFGVFAGDEYSFKADGTGLHDKASLKYSISEGKIYVTEGAAGTRKTTLTIDESEGNAKLFAENGDNYYVDKATYDEISTQIRAEYTAELIRHEAWAVHKGSSFVMYYMFYDGGWGWAVMYGGTYSLKWEYVDNDTLKLSVITDREQSATYDIVVEGNSFKLVSTVDSAVTATPHN